MKARTVEEQQDDDLVRTMRQKTQLELVFPPRATGEARSDAAEATEIRTATIVPESSMMVGVTREAVVARDNLRQALDHVRRNKGAPGIDGMTIDDCKPPSTRASPKRALASVPAAPPIRRWRGHRSTSPTEMAG